MAIIKSYQGKVPKIGKNVFLAENVIIIGDVEIGDYSNIWYGCVIRGDVHKIRIGSGTNIQDGTIVHVAHADGPTLIGDNVTIGHMCLIHACIIQNNAFIGMHSTIIDYAEIGEYSMIGANSLVTKNKKIPAKQMWLGSPAIYRKDLNDEEIVAIIDSAERYIALGQEYLRMK